MNSIALLLSFDDVDVGLQNAADRYPLLFHLFNLPCFQGTFFKKEKKSFKVQQRPRNGCQTNAK